MVDDVKLMLIPDRDHLVMLIDLLDQVDIPTDGMTYKTTHDVGRHAHLSLSFTSRHSGCFHHPKALRVQKALTLPSLGDSKHDQNVKTSSP